MSKQPHYFLDDSFHVPISFGFYDTTSKDFFVSLGSPDLVELGLGVWSEESVLPCGVNSIHRSKTH